MVRRDDRPVRGQPRRRRHAAVEAVSNDQRAKYEAGEAYVIYSDANASAGQQAPASQQFLLIVSSADRTVDDPAFAADVAAITARLAALQATVDGVDRAGRSSELVDPIGVPAAAGLVSPDRTTVRIVGRVPGDGAGPRRPARARARR